MSKKPVPAPRSFIKAQKPVATYCNVELIERPVEQGVERSAEQRRSSDKEDWSLDQGAQLRFKIKSQSEDHDIREAGSAADEPPLYENINFASLKTTTDRAPHEKDKETTESSEECLGL